MQWNKESGFQQPQQDVYADVKTSYTASPFTQENASQEFSLSSIQQKLGAISTAEEADLSSASPDVMPSTQTLNMSYQREYSSEKTRAASRLSVKTKVMIASYVLVVLALIVAVTVCGVGVTGTFGTALSDNEIYADVATTVESLTAQYEQEMQNFDGDARARELGYVGVSDANNVTYSELETRPAQNFEVESNWFDALCDWFSSIFGG